MGILTPRKTELDLREFISWADASIRTFQARGMDVCMFILPEDKQGPVFTRTCVNPLPKDDELRLDKHPKTGKITAWLRGRQVTFTSKLTNGCLFRLKQ